VLRVEGQKIEIALRSGSDPQLSTLNPQPRRAVTLIELLIVMLIITILAGLILGVAAVAGETARQLQSEHTVLRLHKLLMEHYDTYKTRRVKVRQEVLDGIEGQKSWSPARKRQAVAAARLYALRELMLMEIPDRWSDVTLSANPMPLNPFFVDVSSSSAAPYTNAYRTPLSSIYLRRFRQQQPSPANESAECLYLIVTLACGDGEARSQFGEDSIGDTDADGAQEFLDGWGRPIHFLRWAPGYDSQVQINANTLRTAPGNDPPVPANNQVWASAAAGDHDPFDLYRVDPPAFRLVPLIFSAGGDETIGIYTADSYVVRAGLKAQRLEDVPDPDNWPIILPWAPINDPDDGSRMFLGTVIPDSGATDNIHNHLLGRR
jgi:type II secretory pathway pseudopilin PulG